MNEIVTIESTFKVNKVVASPERGAYIEQSDFVCSDKEKELLEKINNNDIVEVYKNRVVGFTTFMCAYSTCLLLKSDTVKNILYLADNKCLATRASEKVKEFINQSGDGTKFKRLSHDLIETESGNKILFMSKNSLKNSCRGWRFDLVIVDECLIGFDDYCILGPIVSIGGKLITTFLPDKVGAGVKKDTVVWPVL